jgi:gas vesicle protein
MSSKFIAGLLLGAAAGAALGYFLNTEKGKEFVEDLKTAAKDAGDNIKESYNRFEGELKQTVQKGKAAADEFEKKANNFTT